MGLFDNLFSSGKPEQESFPPFKLEISGKEVPVHVILERRYNSRITINHKGITIKLSQYLSQADKQAQVKSFLDWAKTKVQKRPELLHQRPSYRVYKDGDVIRLYEEDFRVQVKLVPSEFAEVKVRNGELVLFFPEKSTEKARLRTGSRMVARIMAMHFKEKVEKRLRELNEQHFKKKLNRVTLKNNSSNWGSCSTKGNINISTRLLFAPLSVIEYVLIHELAHLVHHDHSERFWNLVESILPNYTKAEKWLKKHSEDCYF